MRVGIAFYFTHNQVLVWHTLPQQKLKEVYRRQPMQDATLIYRDTIISYLRSHLYLYYIYLYISFNFLFLVVFLIMRDDIKAHRNAHAISKMDQKSLFRKILIYNDMINVRIYIFHKIYNLYIRGYHFILIIIHAYNLYMQKIYITIIKIQRSLNQIYNLLI